MVVEGQNNLKKGRKFGGVMDNGKRNKRKVVQEMESYHPKRSKDSSASYTLFAGDKADGPTLSFVYVYRQHVMHKKANEYLTAILPDSNNFKDLHSRQVHILKGVEVSISTTVDLSEFEKHRVVRGRKYGKIFFYFPTKTFLCNMMRKFFLSSKKVLSESGKIFITLSRKQSNAHVHLSPRRTKKSWNLVRVAANAGLTLCEAMPLTHHIAEEFKFRVNNDIIKAVNSSGAVTYTFQRAETISPKEIPIISNNNDFYENINKRFKWISKKHPTTYTGLVLALTSVSKRTFTSMDIIFVNKLLNSENHASLCECTPRRENPDYHRTELCDKNLSTMISQYLHSKTTNDDVVTSIIFSVYCPHFFKAHFHPFVRILSYFSFSWDSITKGLTAITKQVERKFSVSVPHFCWEDIPTYMRTRTSSACSSVDADYKKKHLQTIYAVCEFEENDGCIFYAILYIVVRKESLSPPPASPTVQVFEIGRLMKFTVFNKDCYVTLWNLEMLSCIQFHVMDYRMLLYDAYFCKSSSRKLVYRTASLFPPVYIRYLTFWVDKTFFEMEFFMLVWNVAANLVKSLKLIKACKDEFAQKEVRTYRFSYSSNEKILSYINATKIHKMVVQAIESHLQLQIK